MKGPWKRNEDEVLKKLVAEFGAKNWSCISNKLQEYNIRRLGKQCRERWYNHLSPDVRKDPWTKEEDKIIVDAYDKLGSKWTTISYMLKGRTPNAIKNRWNSTLKRLLNDSSKKRKANPAAQAPTRHENHQVKESHSLDSEHPAVKIELPQADDDIPPATTYSLDFFPPENLDSPFFERRMIMDFPLKEPSATDYPFYNEGSAFLRRSHPEPQIISPLNDWEHTRVYNPVQEDMMITDEGDVWHPGNICYDCRRVYF